MKLKLYLFQALLICLFISCENKTEPEINNVDVDVTIKNSEVYEYNTGISGDEEGVSIKTQAKNFEISDIVRNASTRFEAVYRYKPKAGFIGADYIELEIITGSDGASLPKNEKSIKILIHVTK
jgi:hypothetical protein